MAPGNFANGVWTDFAVYSAGSALLLAADDRVRFVPDAIDGGTDSFSYVAWDQTSGTHGSTADVTTAGGTSAFSIQSNNATIDVTAVNDAPVIPAGATAAIGELGDTTGSSTLDEVHGTLAFTDVDPGDTGHSASVTAVAASGVTGGLVPNAGTLQSFLHIDATTKSANNNSGSMA